MMIIIMDDDDERRVYTGIHGSSQVEGHPLHELRKLFPAQQTCLTESTRT
jgi:hypothetical protein